MHVNLLGPIEAVTGDGAIGLAGTKQRAVLAMLALETGSTVSADRLIDGLWGDHPPASALKLVQLYVSHLRKALGEDLIATHGRGYELRLDRRDVDAGRFERLLAQGAAREALRLWRGSPLADVAGEPFAAAEIRRLEELHTAALEVAIDQDLDAGRHREALPEIDALLAAEPLREPLHARRILALYRCGRQADALEAYREARRTLIEQIGVEPGPELRRLHEAILRQDPALDPPADDSRRTPLFGREREFERLRSLWHRVRDGVTATALIAGEPGIGKTRLVLALAEEVRREGGEVSWGDLEALTPGRPSLLVLDGAVAPADPGEPVLVVLTAVEADGIVADERIALGPLGAGDAAGLARFDAGDDGPVDRIVAASRGVPGLIRRAARDWVRAQARARVADAAARTSTERHRWQLAESNLTTSVVELQGIRDPVSAAPGACPYKGLESFDIEDAAVFFGRERLVAEMVARLAGAHVLGIVGPSGSGKSSAMRAGLLAAIGAGVLPGSETWARALMRPGERPLQALPELPIGPAVLAVDQFEELFTVCRDERERAAFVDALLARVWRDTIVIVAVRADFYGACARYPELSRVLGANHVLVGPMRRHELRRAVELPARHAGIPVEPGFADALVADVEHEPGALPLLSTALFELWDEGLTLDAYERTGGVRGAVARIAEAAYGRLGDDGRAEARRVLLRLAGDGDVRTRVPLAELGDGAVLSALARDRLVTIGEGEAEVAHEALLREWPRLRTWLEEDADGRRVHQRLTNAAREWQAGGRDRSELYRGARLVTTLDWQAGHAGELNELERAFLHDSRVDAEQENEHQRRTNRRLRSLLAGVAALLAIAVAAGVLALDQRGDARAAAVIADAQRLGTEAQNQERLDQALLSARAAVALDETPATRGSLLSVLQRLPAALGVIDHGAGMYGAAISPDGKLMATGDERGVVVVYDAVTHQPIGRPHRFGTGFVQDVHFSPDGRTLAVSYSDPRAAGNHSGLLDLIDPRTGKRRLHLRAPALPEPTDFVYADVAFLPNGRDLLVRPVDGTGPDGQASPVYRVDRVTGALKGRLQVGRYAADYNASETADRRRMFLTSRQDHRTWELDTQRLRVVRSWPVGDLAGAVSPDGREFALGSDAGAVRVLDLTSGRVRSMLGGHHGEVSRLRFTPDGRTLVTAGADGQVLVWDVDQRSVAQRFNGHSREIDGLDMTADGRTLITASLDGRAILWDLAGDRRLDRRFPVATPFELPFTPRGIAVTPDGRTLALTNNNGTVDLIDAATLRRRRALFAQVATPTAVAFSPNGRLLAVSGLEARITLWNARTLAPAGELQMPFDSDALAFSHDGTLLAAAEEDVRYPLAKGGPLRVWDVRRRALTAFRGGSAANSIAFSPDGTLLAAAETERGTEVREAGTGRLVKRLDTGDFARSVAFSPNGKLLFVGQWDGRGHLISTATWTPVGQPLAGHTARITYAEFTPDGRTLVTAAADGTVILWDVKTQKPIGSPFELAPNTFASAALSPDGSRLFAVSTRGEGIRFDMSPAAWKRHACLVAGRELTPAEWSAALPSRPYQAVCSGA